jgi:DNA-binding beta-propeller fold protein YncE
VALRHIGFVELPAHTRAGGFDHAAAHQPSGRVFVAHTANDAVDIFDLEAQKYLESIPGLAGVAGALVAETPELVFTSNRGENTIGLFVPAGSPVVEKIGVGIRPNGLAYDPGRARLLVAHVGDPALPGSCTVSVIDVPARRRLADIALPGRTRWAVYDPGGHAFHVNIADPPQIVGVNAGDPIGIRRVVPMPAAGPHGLDLDVERRRLFCACDGGVVVEVDADTGTILGTEPIAGVPDVVFVNPLRRRLYIAIGDPGVIEVFATTPLRRQAVIATDVGAHTLAFDAERQLVCAFLPRTHRAAVYKDES